MPLMSRFPKMLAALLDGLLAIAILNCSRSDNSELARIKTQAKRGDPEAQYALGSYYHDGQELAPNYEAATAWFSRAAQQGHPGAQLALGKMLLNAEAGLPDEVQAARWIRLAAEQGYAPAQNELAMLYADGIGVVQDQNQSLTWVTRAAEQGLVEAQYHLGCFLCFTNRNAVPADMLRGCQWFSVAAAAGDQESQEALEPLKARFTPAQLEEVKRRVEAWKRAHPDISLAAPRS